jgi:hypothetical protein
MRGLMVRRAWSRRFVAAVLAVVVALSAVVAQVQTSSAAVTTLATFSSRGFYTWKVPTGVTNATFDVYGASGGSVVSVIPPGIVNPVSYGGEGGEAKGKFTVHAGEVFEIIVGGQGGTATVGSSTGGIGANGGGYGDQVGPAIHVSGGGGGASDVLIGGRGNTCASTHTCGGYVTFIAAGGGGGGSDAGANGDAGVGLSAGGCPHTGADASQDCGGPSGCANDNGQFGVAANACLNTGWGAGGGGWYGGGSLSTGGGGGSSYISQLSISGSFHTGVHQGDGKVIITTTT